MADTAQPPTTASAYLDHAATTPMFPEAVQSMTEQLAVTGNASSLHGSGRRARRAVEESREALGAALGARPSEVVFTSGGTEADNLAVKGLYWSRRAADPRRTRVLASPVEHHAVLDAVHWLADHEGATVEWLPVDGYGRVHAEALREAIARDPDDVALATVMWANNEIGTLMPVRELADAAAEFGVPLHADAVQAVGQVEVDFAASGLAALTVSGHKTGGPYGVGALLLGREYAPVPLLHGGGQEREVRSGTLDVPAIAAFATAARLSAERRAEFARDAGALRDALVDAVRAAVPDAVLNGDPDPAGRLPANAHFSFPGCEGDSLLLLLDAQGIECSTGSACTAGVAQPSHVLLATGVTPALARGTLRFSFGHTSRKSDVTAVADAIGPAVERARGAGLS
ncbi:cysteine desulfurase family protein [Streptomyces sp. ODS28]|uniref:cysteine desulfurase family protein n=1 Tax=Streptomyces sp. ODS28 TaxID=3136688 RepID=UPI0031E5E80E